MKQPQTWNKEMDNEKSTGNISGAILSQIVNDVIDCSTSLDVLRPQERSCAKMLVEAPLQCRMFELKR